MTILGIIASSVAKVFKSGYFGGGYSGSNISGIDKITFPDDNPSAAHHVRGLALKEINILVSKYKVFTSLRHKMVVV